MITPAPLCTHCLTYSKRVRDLEASKEKLEDALTAYVRAHEAIERQTSKEVQKLALDRGRELAKLAWGLHLSSEPLQPQLGVPWRDEPE